MGRHVHVWSATCGSLGRGREPRVPGCSSWGVGGGGLFLPRVPYHPTGILSAALPRGPGVAPEYHQTGEGALREALNPPSTQTTGGVGGGHWKGAEPLASWHLCPPQAEVRTEPYQRTPDWCQDAGGEVSRPAGLN